MTREPPRAMELTRRSSRAEARA